MFCPQCLLRIDYRYFKVHSATRLTFIIFRPYRPTMILNYQLWNRQTHPLRILIRASKRFKHALVLPFCKATALITYRKWGKSIFKGKTNFDFTSDLISSQPVIIFIIIFLTFILLLNWHLLEIVTNLPESTSVKHETISGKLDVPLRSAHVTVDNV